MSPAFIPSIKDLASRITMEQAETIFKSVMKEKTTAKIKRILHDRLLEIAPQMEMLISE